MDDRERMLMVVVGVCVVTTIATVVDRALDLMLTEDDRLVIGLAIMAAFMFALGVVLMILAGRNLVRAWREFDD